MLDKYYDTMKAENTSGILNDLSAKFYNLSEI